MYFPIDYKTLIHESVDQLIRLEETQLKPKLKVRIRFLRYLKEGSAKTQVQAGQLIGFKSSRSNSFWQIYAKKGIDGLLEYNNKGTGCLLTSREISKLRHFLHTNQAATLAQIQTFLWESMGVSYSLSGVCRLCQRYRN